MLNHSNLVDISLETPGTEFFIDNWQISDTVKYSEYGSYVIQMSWNNESAAGFREITLDLFADTELLWDIPKFIFDSDEIFAIDVYFNDTGIGNGINADSFSYSIQGNTPRTDNVTINGDGNYTISIACDDSEFAGFGNKQIEIFANELYHNNQSEDIDLTILGLTEIVDISLINNTFFNSSETIVIELYYNDTVRDLGIDSAIVEYSIEGNSYRSDNVVDLGNGNYTIDISAIDNEFGGYGLKTIGVRINKDFYYNHTLDYSINLLGETSVASNQVPLETDKDSHRA